MRGPRKKTVICLILAAAAVAAAFSLYIHHENTTLTVRCYTLACPSLPAPFEGFTIVLLSDLHGGWFGEGQEDLLRLAGEHDPDMIALTGDMIDGRRKNPESLIPLYAGLPAIAPCYAVPGNHEGYLTPAELERLHALADDSGVLRLDGRCVTLTRGGARIMVGGLGDSSRLLAGRRLSRSQWQQQAVAIYGQWLNDLAAAYPPEDIGILLCHNPIAADAAIAAGWDVVLSGHTHGGQVGLPGGYGLLSPETGFFGRAAGAFWENGGWSVISRGMGNSVVPVRIACPVELVVITLTAGEPR
ncbi:MAG: metallophosphoesterase [Christensenellales bacterium]|jgi:predicted MPP superfamily phosphohydrolase